MQPEIVQTQKECMVVICHDLMRVNRIRWSGCPTSWVVICKRISWRREILTERWIVPNIWSIKSHSKQIPLGLLPAISHEDCAYGWTREPFMKEIKNKSLSSPPGQRNFIYTHFHLPYWARVTERFQAAFFSSWDWIMLCLKRYILLSGRKTSIRELYGICRRKRVIKS